MPLFSARNNFVLARMLLIFLVVFMLFMLFLGRKYNDNLNKETLGFINPFQFWVYRFSFLVVRF